MGRKHCGKRRNCSLRAISSFPTVFSKDFFCRRVKTRACLGKGEDFFKLKAVEDDKFTGIGESNDETWHQLRNGQNLGYQHFLCSYNTFKCTLSDDPLTLSQTSPGFYVSAVEVF